MTDLGARSDTGPSVYQHFASRSEFQILIHDGTTKTVSAMTNLCVCDESSAALDLHIASSRELHTPVRIPDPCRPP